MNPPVITTYHGDHLSIAKLRKLVHIGEKLINRWRRQGRLNEATIDAYLEQRAQRREARDKAKAAGVRDGTLRMRVARDYPAERLYEPTMSLSDAARLANAARRAKTAAAEAAKAVA